LKHTKHTRVVYQANIDHLRPYLDFVQSCTNCKGLAGAHVNGIGNLSNNNIGGNGSAGAAHRNSKTGFVFATHAKAQNDLFCRLIVGWQPGHTRQRLFLSFKHGPWLRNTNTTKGVTKGVKSVDRRGEPNWIAGCCSSWVYPRHVVTSIPIYENKVSLVISRLKIRQFVKPEILLRATSTSNSMSSLHIQTYRAKKLPRCARRWPHDVVKVLGCTFLDMQNVGSFKNHHPLRPLGVEVLSVDVVLDTRSIIGAGETTESKPLF